MTDLKGNAFWQEMADLVVSRPIVLDRPRGAAHPRYPELVYPSDYGYLEMAHLRQTGVTSTSGLGLKGKARLQESCALMIRLSVTLKFNCCSAAPQWMWKPF